MSAATRMACASSSASSRFPAGFRATSRPRCPVRSMRVASSATPLPARVRGGVRQPRPGGGVRRRRRRGRDRTAGGELALQQVPRPRTRWCGPADPPPQRLQDRQPDGARAHPGGRAGQAPRGLRPPGAHRRRRRGLRRAPSAGRCARSGARRHRRDPRRASPRWGRGPPDLADDRPAHAEGVDRAAGGRRPPGRGDVARPPGPARRSPIEPRAPPSTRGVDAELSPRRVVR